MLTKAIRGANIGHLFLGTLGRQQARFNHYRTENRLFDDISKYPGRIKEKPDPIPYFFLSRFSFTRYLTILLTKPRGNGWSTGNRMVPFATSYFERDFLKAMIAEVFG